VRQTGEQWQDALGAKTPREVIAEMELSLATRSVADHVVLEIGGEIDVYTAPKLRERLLELVAAGAKHVVVDLSRVEFLDSTGLGVLVGAHRRLRASHGTLSLVCPHERLLKIFRITGLDSVFDIHRSVEEATGGSTQAARTGA
jgi:anti-sigma B factor antagonist